MSDVEQIIIWMPQQIHEDYQGLTLTGIHDRLIERIASMPLKYQGQMTILVEDLARSAEKSAEGEQLKRERNKR